ncbi:nuclear transport factor 2 family protein [Emcibacter sp.]|uniref:nuclear transport factor 2 family protein n=1 Tax=Emcibacter sp. TaxID=1979954 RepID=UPI002AA8CB75|nr:nuclear transport factor 2 family protein [Emcibacter sp.]
MSTDTRLENWHKAVFDKDLEMLTKLLHENVEFNSPFVWTPYQGRDTALAILGTVVDVFENFKYHREWIDGNEMALEFSASIGKISLKGIDLIRWDDDGKIINFEVMVRPGNGLMTLAQTMQQRLAEKGVM